MWEKRIVHEGLHAFRVVRGVTQEEVEIKARLQLALWADRWRRKQELEQARHKRASKTVAWESQNEADRRAKAVALELTKEAEATVEGLKSLLPDALARQHPFDWKQLEDRTSFSKDEPLAITLKPLPPEPQCSDPAFLISAFTPKLTFMDWIIPPLRKRKLRSAQLMYEQIKEKAETKYAQAHYDWEKLCADINRENENAKLNHSVARAAWQKEKQDFAESQRRYSAGISEFRTGYLNGDPQAIMRFCNEVLSRSEYPDSFPRDCTLSFDSTLRILIVDYELPSHNVLPHKKQIRYVSNRGQFQDVFLSESEFKRIYDDVMYQICLRTLHELFWADEGNFIDSIVFNGWVQAIDKATGANTHPCIMSVQVKKQDFMALNLSQVDLKTCFRSLKGISGGRLADLSPVRPVLMLNKEDPRFVSSYSVAASLDDRTNLAAMDWLDFENLIRELFAKEFSKDGGEVKITQASRDGGVDAIAFDPDPIRGGKIVIQAKRYTNTVGVSAVRDLYGTVHNEGATKGILVTTSDYGPDAYEFAKGKPITLLSGSELLYLLGRHGYHAKIDLKEAKKLLG
jgi:restriction system protein